MTPQEIFEEEKARVDALIGRDCCEKSRERIVVMGRIALAFLLYDLYEIPSTQVGRMIGKDHSTIIHYCKVARECLDNPKIDPELYKILTN